MFEIIKESKKKKLRKQLLASYVAPTQDENSGVVTIQWTNKDDMIAVGFENGTVIVFGF